MTEDAIQKLLVLPKRVGMRIQPRIPAHQPKHKSQGVGGWSKRISKKFQFTPAMKRQIKAIAGTL